MRASAGETRPGGEAPSPCPDCGQAQPTLPQADVTGALHCVHCGAQLQVGALSLGGVVLGFFDSLISLEQPLLRTTFHLLTRPGRVARAWIQGRRRSYTSPMKYLVVLGLIVALVFSMVGDPATRTGGLDGFVTQYFALFCILLLLPIAWVQTLIGRLLGVPCAWLEWYVAGLYAVAAAVLLQLLSSLFSAILPAVDWMRVLGQYRGLIPVIWLCWAAWGFAPEGLRLRALVASLLGQVGVVALAAGLQAWLGS